MRPFFGGETPQLQLLTALDTQPMPVTVTALAGQLGWDRTTVAHRLQSLQASLATFQPALALNWDAQGVHYARQADFNLGAAVSVLVSQTAAGQLFESLYAETAASLTAAALTTHLSESTLRRTVGQMGPILAAYHVTIDIKSWRLVGTEAVIRYLGFQYYWNTYGTVKWPFPTSLGTVQVSNDQLLDRLAVTLEISEARKLEFWAATGLLRQQRGHAAPADWWSLLVQTELLPSEQWWRADGFVLAHQAAADSLIAAWEDRLPPCDAVTRQAIRVGLVRSAAWNRVFGDLPLLVGGDRLLAQLKSQPVFARFLATASAVGLPVTTPFWQLRGFRLMQRGWPAQLDRPAVRVLLALDATPVDRAALGTTLKERYAADYRLTVVTQPAAADLILTNYNVVAEQPVIYVNDPMTAGDWQHLDYFLAHRYVK